MCAFSLDGVDIYFSHGLAFGFWDATAEGGCLRINILLRNKISFQQYRWRFSSHSKMMPNICSYKYLHDIVSFDLEVIF